MCVSIFKMFKKLLEMNYQTGLNCSTQTKQNKQTNQKKKNTVSFNRINQKNKFK